MRLRSCCVVLLLAAGACKSAGPKTAPAAPTQPAFVQSYVGQNRILLGQGDQQSVVVKAGSSAAGECDVAVGIERATLAKGVLRMSLGRLGRPRVASDKPAKKDACRSMPAGISLSLELAAEEAEAVDAALAKVLLTPEAYLVAHEVAFDKPAQGALDSVAAAEGIAASSEERMLGRKVTAWPRRVLWVDAEFHDLTGKVRRAVELDFGTVVGVDGRLYQPQLSTFLGSTQEELVKRAFTLWRFEPARTDEKPVASRISGRMTLRIY